MDRRRGNRCCPYRIVRYLFQGRQAPALKAISESRWCTDRDVGVSRLRRFESCHVWRKNSGPYRLTLTTSRPTNRKWSNFFAAERR
jgi:hypothetical protein